MRRLFTILSLFITSIIYAQQLTGTWLGEYQQTRYGNTGIYFYRFYLLERNDSVLGICESLADHVSTTQFKIQNAKVAAKYIVTGTLVSDTAQLKFFQLNTGEMLETDQPLANPGTLPPVFSNFDCYVTDKNKIEGVVSNIAVPVKNNVSAAIAVTKISSEPPVFIEEYFEPIPDRNRQKGKLLAGLFKKKNPKEKEIKTKEEPAAIPPPVAIAPRTDEIQQQVSILSRSITLDIYDNGVVDNDSVSIYLDDMRILSNQRLTTKAIHLTIDLEEDRDHVFKLFAHNMGDISPNTALVVITDGDKKYNVQLSGSLQKNAVIILRHNKQ
ncbi:MAG TPA: hypothetical protein VHM26_14615 [Chitinophagaceae bacterium]|jgi:hypothetical protein|nr:hypothetical protein [Chitinophagaceae bacterium]